jgi:hypothetical protein
MCLKQLRIALSRLFEVHQRLGLLLQAVPGQADIEGCLASRPGLVGLLEQFQRRRVLPLIEGALR